MMHKVTLHLNMHVQMCVWGWGEDQTLDSLNSLQKELRYQHHSLSTYERQHNLLTDMFEFKLMVLVVDNNVMEL
jgi:hypothetical protein